MKENLLKDLGTSRDKLVSEINRLTEILNRLDYEIECVTSYSPSNTE